MIIVTGGAGFIGSNLLRDLNERGSEPILVVDSLGSSEKWKNLVGKNFLDYCDKHEFLNRVETGRGLPDNISAIIHLGACSSTMEKDAAYVMDTNFQYSKTLCSFANKNDIRFIYASSAATYGNGEQGFDDDPALNGALRPLNIYAYSKLLFDRWVLSKGLATTVLGLRFFNVFGPNEYHKGPMRSVVLKAFEQIKAGQTVELFRSYRSEYADGEQQRDFIYVRDCTEAICALLERPSAAGVLNLGSGKANSWLALIRAVFSALGRAPDIRFIDMPEELREKYQYFTEAEMSRFKSVLPEWQARPLEAGVEEYVRDYLDKEFAIR